MRLLLITLDWEGKFCNVSKICWEEIDWFNISFSSTSRVILDTIRNNYKKAGNDGLPAVDCFITMRISRPHRFMSLRMVKTPEYLVSVLCWSNFYFLHNSRLGVTCCVILWDKSTINSTSASFRGSCHNCKSVYGLSCCSQIQFSCHSFKGE